MTYEEALQAWAIKFGHVKETDLVLSVEPCVIYEGYCETCRFETAGLEIAYKDGSNRTRYKQVYGSFKEIFKQVLESAE